MCNFHLHLLFLLLLLLFVPPPPPLVACSFRLRLVLLFPFVSLLFFFLLSLFIFFFSLSPLAVYTSFVLVSLVFIHPIVSLDYSAFLSSLSLSLFVLFFFILSARALRIFELEILLFYFFFEHLVGVCVCVYIFKRWSFVFLWKFKITGKSVFEREFGNLQLFLSKFWISFFFEINVSRKNITLDFLIIIIIKLIHWCIIFIILLRFVFNIVNFFYRIRSILIRKEDGYALVEARRWSRPSRLSGLKLGLVDNTLNNDTRDLVGAKDWEKLDGWDGFPSTNVPLFFSLPTSVAESFLSSRHREYYAKWKKKKKNYFRSLSF